MLGTMQKILKKKLVSSKALERPTTSSISGSSSSSSNCSFLKKIYDFEEFWSEEALLGLGLGPGGAGDGLGFG
jgi:hypothetical protein